MGEDMPVSWVMTYRISWVVTYCISYVVTYCMSWVVIYVSHYTPSRNPSMDTPRGG